MNLKNMLKGAGVLAAPVVVGTAGAFGIIACVDGPQAAIWLAQDLLTRPFRYRPLPDKTEN